MWKKLLLVVLLAGIAAWAYLQFRAAPPRTVSTVNATNGSIVQKLNIDGVVINNQAVNITALLDGELTDIVARTGDAVKAGGTLARLDDRQAKTLLDKADAELAYKKQSLATATRAYNRQKKLSNNGSTSKQILDDSLDALRSAQAALKIAEANIDLAKLQLQNATIVAPFDGTVTKQTAEAGQWVEAGTPLFTLVANVGFVVEAAVNASDWQSISVGQTAILSTESSPETWTSEVNWIAPSVTRDSRDASTVAVRFPPGADAPDLLLGQEVSSELELKRVDDVLVLPLQLMIEDQPGKYSVFVLNEGIAAKRPVRVGMQNTMDAEITDGIDDTDKVIVLQGPPLFDGQPVEQQP